ncbi:MAG TPA: hypothetical protein VEW74_00120, partial [Candidatus Nitrosotalea sp.]|nr:hypothetical protein [Candidatus Nitrosotalea sp.]
MDFYHVTLFLHITTLLVAAGATGVTKLAIGRRARGRTVGEVLDWHNVAMGAAKLFPICLAAFVITGAYMLSVNRINAWSTGFVVAGLVGVVLLLMSGVFLATKGKVLKQRLEGMAKNGADQPAPTLTPGPFVGALPFINSAIALSVAFDMVTKPLSIPVAVSVVAIGIALGAAIGMRR